jgi:hypothetical protein
MAFVDSKETGWRSLVAWRPPYCVNVLAATALVHLASMVIKPNPESYGRQETWLCMVLPSYVLLYLFALGSRRTGSRVPLFVSTFAIFLMIHYGAAAIFELWLEVDGGGGAPPPLPAGGCFSERWRLLRLDATFVDLVMGSNPRCFSRVMDGCLREEGAASPSGMNACARPTPEIADGHRVLGGTRCIPPLAKPVGTTGLRRGWQLKVVVVFSLPA